MGPRLDIFMPVFPGQCRGLGTMEHWGRDVLGQGKDGQQIGLRGGNKKA